MISTGHSCPARTKVVVDAHLWQEPHFNPIEWTAMPPLPGQNYQDRQATAAKARQALVEKFRARPAADDPAVQQREAERKAVIEARKLREAERAEARRLEEIETQKRLAAEAAAAKEAKERADAERTESEIREAADRERLAAEEIELKAMLEVEKKAERDARYAARKARKVERKGAIDRYR